MASAELPYYCHICNATVRPVRINGQDNEEIVCPECNGGFIEKIEEGTSSDSTASPNNDGFSQYGRPVSINTMDMLFGRNTGTGNNSFPNMFAFNYPHNRTEPSSSRNETVTTNISNVSPGAPYNLRQRPIRPGSSNSVGSRGTLTDNDLIQDVVRRVFGGVDPPFIEFSLGGGGNFPAFNFMELHGNTGDYAWGPNGLDNIISQLLGQLENAGPPPASKDAIERLPTIVITKDDVDKGKDCTVCMDNFKVNETAKKLPCNHFFHIPCIEPWLELHNTCPICRKVVEEKGCGPQSSTNYSTHYSPGPNTQGPGMSGVNNNNNQNSSNARRNEQSPSNMFSLFSNIFNPPSNNQDPQT